MMKRVGLAAPVVALGLTLTGCEVPQLPVGHETPAATTTADDAPYLRYKKAANFFAAKALEALRSSASVGQQITPTEQGEYMCAFIEPDMSVPNQVEQLRATACVRTSDGTFEVGIGRTVDTNNGKTPGSYSVGMTFAGNGKKVETRGAADIGATLTEIESAFSDTSPLISMAGDEGMQFKDKGVITTAETWQIAAGSDSRVTGMFAENTASADQSMPQNHELSPETHSKIFGSIVRIADVIG